METNFKKKLNLRYTFLAIIFIIVIFSFILYKSDPKYSFGADSLVKLIQAESLVRSNFSSEQIYYPAIDIDPDYHYFPFKSPFLIHNKNRYIGQYPILFSFLSAVILKISKPLMLIIICLMLSFLILILFQIFWKPNLITLITAALCTPILLIGFTFSEHSLLLLLQIAGLIFYCKLSKLYNKKYIHFIAGFIISIGCWLRLETIIFMHILAFSILIIKYRFRIINFLKNEIFLLIGLFIPLFIFLIFNYFNYGHILGPRYIGNVQEFSKKIIDYPIHFISLLFGWKYIIGFFGFTPLFLIALIYFMRRKNYDYLSHNEKILFWSSILFLFTISIISPDNGSGSNWGPRYLYLAIIPCLILLDKFYTIMIKIHSKGKKIIIYTLIIYSLCINLIGIMYLNFATKEFKNVQKINSVNDIDIKIFNNYLLGPYIGLDYFNSSIIYIKDINSFKELKKLISNNPKYKNIAFIESKIPSEIEQQLVQISSKLQSLLTDFKMKKEFRIKVLDTWDLIEKKDFKRVTIYLLSNK